MDRLVCKKCQHDNLIDAPLLTSNQPLQDWFCKKCDEKLFSVSFKKPAHADTVSIICAHCRTSQKLFFNSSDSSRTSVSWKCKCNKVLVHLKVDHEKQNKAFSPLVEGKHQIDVSKNAEYKEYVRETARWVALAFFGAYGNKVFSADNCSTELGLEEEIDKIVQFALQVRLEKNLINQNTGVAIYDDWKKHQIKGLLGFTVSILMVQAGFHYNTPENIKLYSELIAEELRAKHVGEAIIYSNPI